jgi:hypothetical protein
MRVSTAYFAGAGTVIAAIAVGLGGGLLIGDVMNPKTSGQGTEMTRLERHMSSQPIQAANKPLEPVPHLAAPQPSASGTSIAVAPAQPEPPQQDAANSATAAAPQPDASAAKPVEAAPPQPQPPQPVAREQAAVPEDAMAKARDNEVKRVEDRRRAERHQQWAERRRRPQRPEQELRAVEEKVRQDSEQTPDFAPEPVRIEMPRIHLFGPD